MQGKTLPYSFEGVIDTKGVALGETAFKQFTW